MSGGRIPKNTVAVGARFGRWTVTSLHEKDQWPSRYSWNVMCDCGGHHKVPAASLNNGKSTQCNTCVLERKMKDKRFGMLTCKKILGRGFWMVACDCGTERPIRINALTSGNTTSCGCVKKQRSTQGVATGQKPCSRCEVIKPLSEFQNRKHAPDGKAAHCLECSKKHYYRSSYGVTYEEKVRRVVAQNYRCANAGCLTEVTVESGQLDHCHKTGAIRGILCRPCNVALGFLGDDVRRMAGLVEYLTRKPDEHDQSNHWF